MSTIQDETHPRAKASDELVEQARFLKEELGWTVQRIADELDHPFYTVRSWLRYTRRKPVSRSNPDE